MKLNPPDARRDAGNAALGLLRSFVEASAKADSSHKLTAKDMVTQAEQLLAEHKL